MLLLELQTSSAQGRVGEGAEGERQARGVDRHSDGEGVLICVCVCVCVGMLA